MSLEAERELIFSKLPVGDHSPDDPYLAFLEQSFGDLSLELFQNGYTVKLQALMQDITGRLLCFWRDTVDYLRKTETYQDMHGDDSGGINRGSERLSFGKLIDKVEDGRDSLEVKIGLGSETIYEDGSGSGWPDLDTGEKLEDSEDIRFVEVQNRRAKDAYEEEHSFFVEIMRDTGEFVELPKMESRIRRVSNFVVHDVEYSIGLQPNGLIGRIERIMSWQRKDDGNFSVRSGSTLEFEQFV